MSALEKARAAAEEARALIDALSDVADFGEDAFADLKQAVNTVFNTLAPYATPPAGDVREAMSGEEVFIELQSVGYVRYGGIGGDVARITITMEGWREMGSPDALRVSVAPSEPEAAREVRT